MFNQGFTFDTPRSSSLDSTSNTLSTESSSRSVSPCSASGPFPPPQFSVTDLAASFASSRLRTDAQICYDSYEAYANMDDDAAWEIPAPDDEPDSPPAKRARSFPQRSHSPSRRLQRQVSTRLLCSVTHAKDIASLVSQMVDCNDQCIIVAAEPVSASSDDDEGYNSGEALTPQSQAGSRRPSLATGRSRLEYRRSSELRTTGASVSKAVRLRKGSKQQHRKI